MSQIMIFEPKMYINVPKTKKLPDRGNAVNLRAAGVTCREFRRAPCLYKMTHCGGTEPSDSKNDKFDVCTTCACEHMHKF